MQVQCWSARRMAHVRAGYSNRYATCTWAEHGSHIVPKCKLHTCCCMAYGYIYACYRYSLTICLSLCFAVYYLLFPQGGPCKSLATQSTLLCSRIWDLLLFQFFMCFHLSVARSIFFGLIIFHLLCSHLALP